MNSKQFAWLYMVENGDVGVTHSYYGGVDIVDKCFQKKPFNEWMNGREKRREFSLNEIKTYGVDWNKTAAPESDRVSSFTDTFHDPEYKEIIVGTIVLKNGTMQNWYADAIEVTNVFDMMAQVANGLTKFNEVFGNE